MTTGSKGDTRPLRVALLQLRARGLAEHAEAWADLLRRIDEAAAHNPRLIVAPEAAYPASVLPDAGALHGLRAEGELLGDLGAAARRHGCFVVAGLLLPRDGGAESAIVVLDPDGREEARASRATAGASEVHWLRPGDGPALFDLDGLRVGVLAGADLRDPSLVEGLAAVGVDLLVVAGADPAPAPATPAADVDYVLPARAVESGAWLLRAAKAGLEAEALLHPGRSGVLAPNGTWAVQAPARDAGLVVHRVTFEGRAAPPVEVRGSVLATTDRDSHADNAAAGAAPTVLAAVAADPSPSAVELMEGVRGLVSAAAARGAGLIVLPDFAGNDARAVTQQEFLPLFEALSLEHRATLAVGLAERSEGATYKTVYLVEGGRVLASHRQTLLTRLEASAGFVPGSAPARVVETRAGRIGLLAGAEGLSPAPAAALAAQQPAILAWCAGALGGAGARLEALARTRAVEVGVTVAAAGDLRPHGGATIADGRGAVLASTLAGQAMAAVAEPRPVTSAGTEPHALRSSAAGYSGVER